MKLERKNEKNYEYEVCLEELPNVTRISVVVSELKENSEKEFKTSYNIKNLEYEGELHVFIRFVLQAFNTSSVITYKQVEENLRKNQVIPRYSVPRIITELGFKGQIKKVFFPRTAPNIKFRKSLTTNEFESNVIIKSFLVEELKESDSLIKLFGKTAVSLTKTFSKAPKLGQ